MGQSDLRKKFLFLILGLHCWIPHSDAFPNSVDITNPGEVSGKAEKLEDADYWRASAAKSLSEKLKQENKITRAKNTIMFLGDGWDVQTLTGARIMKGQQIDKLAFGEEAQLYMESFPSTGLSKTYCVDSQTADSACSTTAYLCGVKNNIGTIGVSPNVKRYNCSAGQIKENQVTSILQWAQLAGKSTGIVTTTQITDASPAGAYGHTANRNWECDADVLKTGDNPDTCDDLAEQLILSEPGKYINVILGGGRQKFLPVNVKDSEGFPGQRKDGKNLIETWKSLKASGTRKRGVYVENATDLAKVDASKTDYLLGLFSNDHIPYYHEQKKNGDPTLAEMTEKAIQILSKNPKGFFLFVEGGRIDHAHHENWALRSFWETVEWDRAIQKGDEMTDDYDTLIVITADHGHTMTMAGYPTRGTPITHIAGMGMDGLPYAILGYAQGPGFKEFKNNKRYDIRQDNLNSLDTRQVPLVPLDQETHGGHDVLILAKGPFSHIFGGINEQNFIPVGMAYAACVGSGQTFCKDHGWSNADAYFGPAV